MDNKVTDEELFMMALEENEDAKNELFERYKYIIDILMKKYHNVIYQLGIDNKDIYSECLYGFSDALVRYNQDKPASIATFVTICVERRIINQLVKANRHKNKINTEALSMDYVYDDGGTSLKDMLSDNNVNDPLMNITKEESYQELVNDAKNELSEFEYSVFAFMIKGFDYIEIAKELNKTPKQIDNTMQRIKFKTKKIIENRKNT